MYKLSMLFAILMLFIVGSTLAQPTYQFAEAGTKNFISETTITVGDQISLDLYLTNVGAPQRAGGAWIDFTASTPKISYVSAGRCLAGGAEGCTGPWLDNAGLFLNEPLGTGTVLYQVGNLSSGAVPDDEGHLMVGTLTLECIAAGDAIVGLTISDLVAFWLPINDADVVPASLLIHQRGQPCINDDVCDDGLFCTGVETCVGGICQDGLDPDCEDGIGCTDDICDEVNNVCGSNPNDANCDDGDFCTGVETCDSDLDCQPGTKPCPDDGLFCNGTEICLGAPLNRCGGSSGDPCAEQEVCDEVSDTCVMKDTDYDKDAILNEQDNCQIDPNGPNLGTCYSWSGMTGACKGDNDCADFPNSCSMNQEDGDSDGAGDVCDNCPDDYNPEQNDADGDCIGNACDTFPEVYDSDQPDSDGDLIGDVCDSNPYIPDLLPAADGHYYEFEEGCFGNSPGCENWGGISIEDGIMVSYDCWAHPGGLHCYSCGGYYIRKGIMEFNLSSINGLFTRGQMQAELSLTVKAGDLTNDRCLSLYSIQDANENGVIEEVDIDTEDFIGEVCEDLQSGDTITFDVTTAIEHDLFDPDQTIFSGFVIDRSTSGEDYIEFYDHTDPPSGLRLSVFDINDLDGDGSLDDEDNCPTVYNPDQKNNDGDAEGDECDLDDDNDGILDVDDACPFEDGTGQDADGDGCMDTIEDLPLVVEVLNLPKGTGNSLKDKINNIQNSIDTGNITTAINQLNAFINQVEALRGKKITDAEADMLIQYVTNLINSLSSP